MWKDKLVGMGGLGLILVGSIASQPFFAAVGGFLLGLAVMGIYSKK